MTKPKITLTKEELDRGEAAAIQAGYSPKNARRTAARLLRDPRVRAAIDERIEAQEEAESDAN